MHFASIVSQKLATIQIQPNVDAAFETLWFLLIEKIENTMVEKEYRKYFVSEFRERCDRDMWTDENSIEY